MRTHHLFLGLLTVALIGCNKDADGDGWGEKDDCNDDNAQVHPDADEVCDGVDNNCDDLVDEGALVDAPTFFIDTDGDGFGVDAYTEEACEAPDGYVALDTDCDDGEATTNPDADELCDGADNDCDGEIDEDSATDATIWYLDLDSDTYGDPDATTASCEAPPGYVADGSDCDDSTDQTYPGAPEICDNIDSDCDGDEITGQAGWVDADGVSMDVSSAVEGTETSPELLTISEAGTLYFCGGEWWTSVEIDAPVEVSVVGIGGPEVNTIRGGEILHSSDSGVYPDDDAVLRVSAMGFEGGMPTHYGVVSSVSGDVHVSDSIFLESVSYTGGGAATEFGDLYMNNVTVSDFDGSLGAAFSYHGSTEIVDSTFSGGNGYGVFNVSSDPEAYVYIEASTIQDMASAGVVSAPRLAFSNSQATGNYGGVHSQNTLDCLSSTITGNRGEWGGIYAGTDIILESCEVTGNTGTTYAGGVHSEDGGVIGTNSEIRGNTSSGNSGGIFAAGDSALEGTTVTLNTGYQYGGGIRVGEGDLFVRDSTVSENTLTESYAYGAGIYMGDESLGDTGAGHLDLIDSVVADNASPYAAGGVWAIYGNVELTQTAVYGNTAEYVGGVGLQYGWLTCTGGTDIEAGAWSNTAVNLGGGFWYGAGGISATECDMGTGATENSPDDVYASSFGPYSAYGDDASFECDTTSGCI